MRRYDEPIEVRSGMVGEDEAPAQFLWRNRLWLVRDVLHRWLETGEWWRGPSVRAARGDTDAEPDDDLLAEAEVWRVLAANGRSGEPGVYELMHTWGSGQWRLRAVLD